MDIAKLADEITTDPEAVGYSGMTDLQVAQSLNDPIVTEKFNTLSSAQIYDTFDATEWAAAKSGGLLVEEIKELDRVLATDNPIVYKNTDNAVLAIIAVFGDPSATFTKFKNTRKNNVTRASLLGLGKVRQWHVAEARSR